MHLDLSATLNLISTLAIVGALIFAGLQVRQANLARRDQAAMTVIMTALSENSARALDMFPQIPENASPATIDNLDTETKHVLLEFGLRFEVIGYMAFRGLVELKTVNDLAGGTVIGFWSRIKAWVELRREQTGHSEFYEWFEWLTERIIRLRATEPYVPAYARGADRRA